MVLEWLVSYWRNRWSVVSEYAPKQGNVREHPRREYCKNKWTDADLHIKQFKNDPILGWSNKGEIFKKWKQDEMQVVLDALPKLPVWTEIKNYFFRRAEKSIHNGNPATSELTQKSIILYNLFFQYSDKLGAIGHEASHFLFPKLSPTDLAEFETLSGWDIEVKDDKVYAA